MIDDKMMSENYVLTPPKDRLRDRIRRKLFPRMHCETPEVPNPADYQDVLITRNGVEFTWGGRLRLLLTGRIEIETRTLCQHTLGTTKAKGVVNILPWRWME